MSYADDVKQRMKLNVLQTWPNIMIQDGSMPADVVVGVPATQIGNFYTYNDYVWYTNSVMGFSQLLLNSVLREQFRVMFGYDTPEQMSTQISRDLDWFGSQYNCFRTPAKKAQTTETLELTSGDFITVNAGQEFSTEGSSSKSFQVVNSVAQYPLPTSTAGIWQLQVVVEAEDAGTESNVPKLAINVSKGYIQNLLRAYNADDVISGADTGTDSSLLDTIDKWLSGLSYGTRDSLYNKVKNAGARDVLVVTPRDAGAVRKNGIDIWAITSLEPVMAQDVFTWPNDGDPINPQPLLTFGYVPNLQPVSEDVTGFGLAGFSNATFTVTKDVVTEQNARSVYARDVITIKFISNPPASNSTVPVTLTYAYNKEVADYQNMFIAPNLELFPSILVKEGIRRAISLACIVKIFKNVNVTTVYNDIVSQVNSFINTKGLGEGFAQSDIVGIIEDIEGVDSVVIPFTVMDFVGGTESKNEITIDSREYVFISSDTMSITMRVV